MAGHRPAHSKFTVHRTDANPAAPQSELVFNKSERAPIDSFLRLSHFPHSFAHYWTGRLVRGDEYQGRKLVPRPVIRSADQAGGSTGHLRTIRRDNHEALRLHAIGGIGELNFLGHYPPGSEQRWFAIHADGPRHIWRKRQHLQRYQQ